MDADVVVGFSVLELLLAINRRNTLLVDLLAVVVVGGLVDVGRSDALLLGESGWVGDSSSMIVDFSRYLG